MTRPVGLELGEIVRAVLIGTAKPMPMLPWLPLPAVGDLRVDADHAAGGVEQRARRSCPG